MGLGFGFGYKPKTHIQKTQKIWVKPKNHTQKRIPNQKLLGIGMGRGPIQSGRVRPRSASIQKVQYDFILRYYGGLSLIK